MKVRPEIRTREPVSLVGHTDSAGSDQRSRVGVHDRIHDNRIPATTQAPAISAATTRERVIHDGESFDLVHAKAAADAQPNASPCRKKRFRATPKSHSSSRSISGTRGMHDVSAAGPSAFRRTARIEDSCAVAEGVACQPKLTSRGLMNCPLTLKRFRFGDLHALSGPLVTAGSAHHHEKEHVRASWCREDSLRFAALICTRGALAIEARHVASSHVCAGWTLRLLRQNLSGLRDVKSAITCAD